jgi:type IV pilus assembly protein PilY1
MFQQAYNGITDIDGDGRVDTGFNPTVVYTGYFDPYSCYSFTGSIGWSGYTDGYGDPNGFFIRAGATIEDDTQTTLDNQRPSSLLRAARSTVGICQAAHTNQAGNFSGNWLNYLTASRMDVIRKILYGGMRSTDTSKAGNVPGVTILEGSFVPRDSTVWGFVVLADNRWLSETPMSVYYDISKYTPFPKPSANAAHFFARVKNFAARGSSSDYPVFEFILNANKSTFLASTNITGANGRYFDWVLQEGPNPSSNLLANPTNVIKAYTVRVKVCVPNNLGASEDCREYPNGDLKPVGLLQKNGENGDMYFGLLSGGYHETTRLMGGVLRNHIDHLNKSVNLQTGQIISGGLIWALDTFRIAGLSLRYPSVSDSTGSQKYNNSASWGNPTGETLYEGVRYFARLSQKSGTPLKPTAAFVPTSEVNYNAYNNTPTNKNAPYFKNWNDLPVLTADDCAKPIILLITEVDSEADGDTAVNGTSDLKQPVLSSVLNPGNFPDFSLSSYLQRITDLEGLNQGQKFFYSRNKTDDCQPKTLNSLSEVSGLCPYRPGQEGGYSAAAVAYYARTHNFGLGDGEQGVDVYTVTMSAVFPALDFPLTDNKKITILPASMNNSSAVKTIGRILSFLNYYILEWWVDANGTPYHVKIKVNYEDSGGGYTPDSSYPNVDWDMDILVEYTIDLLTVNSSNRDPAKFYNSSDATFTGALKPLGGTYYTFKAQGTDPFAINPSEVVGLAIKSWKTNNSSSQNSASGFSVSGSTHDGTYMNVGHNAGVDKYGTPATCLWPKGYGVDSAVHKGTGCLTAFGTSMGFGLGDPESKAIVRTFEFSDSPGSAGQYLENPLFLAAKYGGFKDANNNGIPDTGEWEGEDGVTPKNYFQANNITELPDKLEAAFRDIARSISTGTATSASVNSVLSGGISIQTAFYPVYVNPKNPQETINWSGTVYALFVDKYGNLRDAESGSDYGRHLAPTNKVLTFNNVQTPPDPPPACYSAGQAISRCSMAANGDITGVLNPPESIHELKPIWDVGKILSEMDPDDRNIYYLTPKDEATAKLFNVEEATVTELNKHLFHDNYKSILAQDPGVLTMTKPQATKKLIQYIRGTDFPGWRNRTVADPWLGSDPALPVVWRLGDVINSKPVIVGQPVFNYDYLYNDKTYAVFKKDKAMRRQVAYFGSNDGFLHAIDMGFFGSLASGQVGYTSTNKLGSELWALIPDSVLPHLQWLADPTYTHSYYVDLKPVIADVKINGSWKTILVGGLRLGGRPIEAPTSTPSNRDYFYSEVFALDVTNPDAPPTVLWKFSSEDLGLSVGLPTVVTSGGKWYVVVASGPATDFLDSTGQLVLGSKSPYDGQSSQQARLFILNANDGTLVKKIVAAEDNSFFSDPYLQAPLRKSQNGAWNDEVVYYGLTVSRNDACLDKGGVYRLQMVTEGAGGLGGDPLPPENWVLKRLIDVERPVTGAVNSSMDSQGNIWVTFATGRLWSPEDIEPCQAVNTAACRENHQQWLVGVKEPLNAGRMTFGERSVDDLVDVTDISVYSSGGLAGAPTGIYNYQSLASHLQLNSLAGYKRKLNMSVILSGRTISMESSLTQPQITNVGGGRSVIGFTTYEPEMGVCGDLGHGFMYLLDTFTGLPNPELASSFNLISTNNPLEPEEKIIPGGVSTGTGRPSAAVFIQVGDVLIARTSTTNNSIYDLKVETALNLYSNIISWREVFSPGFTMTKEIMSDNLDIAR